ncbi:cell division control 14, SIN component [Ascoidea rubescens DSM 1968]|uniref:Cell division control 14, SIN component n=1 Tax=Ascoidea rubescens DSM 1968 TaxID=1344418 RepID=A0A1D2VM30_9ASCO|nr:cell division control 14, SIN component [Ascoidea rubescens DSM 1968]ODV62661.1 cell division control 14, SIN component [Ascoidea rubescens DSM 1968]
MSSYDLKDYLNDALERLYSPEPSSIHDGLQRLDALLGQLCLAKSSSSPTSASSSSSSSLSSTLNSTTKIHSNSTYNTNNKSNISNMLNNQSHKLWRVPTIDDPIFGKFIKLQDTFEYNVASAIISCLFRMNLNNNLISMKNDYPQEFIILAHKVLQGVLLLHPNSRNLFNRECNMKLLLSYLNYSPKNKYQPLVITTAIQTLVCSLVRSIKNLRNFEKFDGIKIICNLFVKKSTNKEIKVKILEFLFFYLIPETSFNIEKSFEMNLNESYILNQSKVLYKDGLIRRTMEEKAGILKQYIRNVDAIVHELISSKPFGNMEIEW